MLRDLGRLLPTDSAARMLRRPAAWLFLLYTRLAYRRLAGQVARDSDTIAGCDPAQLNTDVFTRRVIAGHV